MAWGRYRASDADKRVSNMLASTLPASVRSVMAHLHAAGYEAYIVGGCVRDAALGIEPHDWDMTTDATPVQMKAAVPFASFDTGIKHGTVTFVVDDEPIEVTTYRVEGAYSDGRHPDSIAFASTLREDLSRRDFTMNAMAWSDQGGIVDPFDGMSDLAARVLRCVGDADERFAEDGLRVMRALRFAATFGLDVEEKTARAVHDTRCMLSAVSEERISAELSKMMEADDGRKLAATVMEFCDVMFQIIPELEPTYGLDQQNPHHDRDCWTHMVDVMAEVEADAALRLAALLHDIGKPVAKVVGNDGVAHYRGHAEEGARIAGSVLRRLKFPRKIVEEVVFLVRYHDCWPVPIKRSARRFLARCGDERRARKLLALMRADRLAHAPASVGDKLDDLDAFAPLMEEALQENVAFDVKSLEVNGRDLVERGWQPGVALGAELRRLFDSVVAGDIPNERAALLAAIAEAPES